MMLGGQQRDWKSQLSEHVCFYIARPIMSRCGLASVYTAFGHSSEGCNKQRSTKLK